MKDKNFLCRKRKEYQCPECGEIVAKEKMITDCYCLEADLHSDVICPKCNYPHTEIHDWWEV